MGVCSTYIGNEVIGMWVDGFDDWVESLDAGDAVLNKFSKFHFY